MTSRLRLFLSYQRTDTRLVAGRLAERLDESFALLMDVEWPAVSDSRIAEVLDDVDVVVVIVGPRWLEQIAAERGPDHQDEEVELLAAALTRPLPVVLVLVDSATVPERDQLPEGLQGLVECASERLAADTFPADVARLTDLLRQLGSPPLPPPPPPDSERALDENVQFTVYRPRAIRPAEWYDLLAFAHLAERRQDAPADEPDPLAQVKAQAEHWLGSRLSDYDDPRSDSRHGVPRDGEITFLPEIPGVEFNPERRVFRWQEDVHREEFRLRAHPDLGGRTARGRLTVYLGVVILAEVDLALRIDSAAPPPNTPQPTPHPDQARPYRKIFASYSHRDVEVVRQFELLAASLGDEYLRDIARLRSGADWDEALLQLIDEADVFQLFWSSNSMLSPYVRREWEYAISLARPYFVRPTYWEDPLPTSRQPALPPESLRRLHFSRIAAAPWTPAPAAPASAPSVVWAAPQMATPPPPAPPRRRSRIKTILAPLAITVIAGTAFGGVLLSSLVSRDQGAAVDPPAASAPARSPTPTHLASSNPPQDSTVGQYVPARIAGTCQDYQLPDDTPIAAGLVGAVRCHPTGDDAPADVWYFEYADQEAMAAAFAELTRGDYRAGDCLEADQEFAYTTDEASGGGVGRLRCYEVQGVASFAWTHDELGVLAVAQDPALSFPALRSWWSTAGPYLEPAGEPSSRPT